MKKKAIESHGYPSQATSSRDRIYLLHPQLGIIASVRGRTLKQVGGSVSGKQQRQQKMGAVTGKTEAVTGKWATEQLRERRKRSRESGPHRFYFLYFPHPFCKKTYFLYFPYPFCKKARIIKSRVIVNSRVVINKANELPICKTPQFWPPNVKGLIFRSPLVKRKAFN